MSKPERSRRMPALVAATFLCLLSSACSSAGWPGSPGATGGEFSTPGAVEYVSEVGWEWQAPEESRILNVEPVAMGAAVTLDTGIVILHGDTGEEVWSHLVSEEEFFSAGLTADGSAFLVARGPDREEPPEETLILDAGTGAVKGEFRVRKDLAPWDLRRVSEAERVHRPEGVLEEYRPLSVIEVDDGTQRWQQEKPLSCEIAPELPSSQDDTAIHGSTLLVLVTCTPEDGGHRPFESAVAVVAVDLADGTELWRQEFAYSSENRFPRISFAVEEDSVLLANNESREVHAIGIESGEIEVSAEGSVIAFHENGILIQATAAQGSHYELLNADLDPIASMETSENLEESEESRHALPLPEGVVGVEIVESDTDETTATIGFTSWETGETKLLDPGLPALQSTSLSQFPGSLVGVPGAVLLVGGEHWGENELIAYQ
ncbi:MULTISPECIES: PQQ-binding-like beta-propeller repeat protein [Nocardiopsis]|uniref:PQQ-binding-like beta-propeller repeat protein n=1 Tax=Nocardiopsis changdeensis TaxID=2831969 RepID=A0ABX8BRM0_9ACTN|nr:MULTISPECIES: PQQ-binding-like beta-propeller repeat protein [Nocardiopsis]QUX24902.1 PQQ-binding-like beta-propeller repeat protein [Nocardiopsis changdeensis]QYX35288.1 PQQ-binding-like beta-propeller repeat protein [Nocardiopsis sp. MT53]